jgi:hypothetical protein
MSAACQDASHKEPHASSWLESIIAVHNVAKRYNELDRQIKSGKIDHQKASEQLGELNENLQTILKQPRCTATAGSDMEKALSNLFTRDFCEFSEKISDYISKLSAK